MAKSKPKKFYFSLRSPYSWLAYRDLMDRYPDVAGELEWIPFWEPDKVTQELLAARNIELPYADMSRAKNLYILQDVKRITTARGLAHAWPVDHAPVWEIPHLGYLAARAAGRGPEYIAAVYRARWEEGRDICDRATIRAVAADLGLDADQVADAADDEQRRAEGAEVLRQVAVDGAFGVPFFVHGFSRFWGIDRLPDFVAHVRAATPPAAALPDPVPGLVGLGLSSDDGHAGGCG
jgi:2-hydroxychromene-2-carboxylate isomerase